MSLRLPRATRHNSTEQLIHLQSDKKRTKLYTAQFEPWRDDNDFWVGLIGSVVMNCTVSVISTTCGISHDMHTAFLNIIHCSYVISFWWIGAIHSANFCWIVSEAILSMPLCQRNYPDGNAWKSSLLNHKHYNQSQIVYIFLWMCVIAGV